MERFRRLFIGERAFYRQVTAIVIPVIIQNIVTNFVNLLDNIMVGQLGTAQVSGVAIAGQLVFIFNLLIFGSLSGPGIFGAQFFGAGNLKGFRDTFRLKIWFSGSILALFVLAALAFHDPLIGLFLKGEGNPEMAEAMLGYGREYLLWMLLGMLPFALSMIYASALREAGETILPMKASVAAVLTNLVFNYLLIFGHLGFPALGVTGAAIATVLSRFVELAIILYAVHGKKLFPFMHGVYSRMKVPGRLMKAVLRRGAPLMVNEALWALGIASLNQIYSMRALYVLAAISIASTISNLFNVVFLSIGNAVAVLVGQALGANDIPRARSSAWRLLFLSVSLCLVIGIVMALLAPVFPRLYNTEEAVRNLATGMILVYSALMPFFAINHTSYYVLRSGGSTVVTFLFDAVFNWVIIVPFAYFLVKGTDMPILTLFALSQFIQLIKSGIGLLLIRHGMWQNNIVGGP
ncbi:MAG: MATE family efflux transporter [Eubacteriales bacterium]|nr:MATE family efflux transporter [Eubacteriales bacterium]